MTWFRVATMVTALAVFTSPAMGQRKQQQDAAAKVEHGEEMNLAVGENKTIPAHDVKNFSEGIPGVADVKLTTDQGQFVVVGQKPGATTLLLIKKDGTQVTWFINVYARPMDVVQRELEQLLEGTTGLRVRRVGGRFFIEGGVNTEAEQKRLQQIASLYPGQVESLVAVGAPAAERKIDIRIDFFFVLYDRTKSYAFGVGWPGRIGGTGIANSQFTYDFLAKATTAAQASIINQPLPFLDMAASNGWAKVLKQSTVISSNGSEANFSSGGEQNFAVANGLTTTIKAIEFGTNLTVLPRYDPKMKELSIKVTSDVSDLTPAVGGTNLPGRNTSKLSTNIDLKLGQSVVLSGIRTRSQRHAISGLPLLSDIPLLGVLFGTHSDFKEEVEGAIFIVPSIIESIPPANMEMINSAIRQYEAYSGDIAKVRSYDKTPPVIKR
ncbi:MAG TPA: pilus assembly protein N-terminal domain-containing protein [Polyangiaceae bacterium]